MIKILRIIGKNKIPRIFLVASFIVTVVILISSYLFTFTFISDDYVLLKSAIEDPYSFYKEWASEQKSKYHRPIVILSFYINYLISKFDVLYYYLFNLFVHIINTIVVYQILRKISSVLYTKYNNSLLIALSLIFLTSPQNLMNVYWISGRTDLLCGLFSFVSIIFLIRFYEVKKIYYLIGFALSSILSFLSKETAVILHLYFIGVSYLFARIASKKQIYFSFALLLIISVLSLLVNISIKTEFFNNLDKTIGSPSALFNYIIYGVASFVLPFDFKDLIYYWNKELILFVLLIVGSSTLIFFIIKAFIGKITSAERKIVSFALGFLLISMFIYFSSYPQMRLYYLHAPMFLISLLILFHKENISKYEKVVSVFLLSILLLYGNTSLIIKTKAINNLTKNLMEILPDKNEYEADKNYICISAVERIGQSWGNPPIQLLASYKVNNNLNGLKNFHSIATLDLLNINELGTSINYKFEGNILTLETNSLWSGFNSIPSVRFNDSLSHRIGNNLIVYSYKEDVLSNGLTSKINIQFDHQLNMEKTEIIFLVKSGYKRMNLKDFYLYVKNNQTL